MDTCEGVCRDNTRFCRPQCAAQACVCSRYGPAACGGPCRSGLRGKASTVVLSWAPRGRKGRRDRGLREADSSTQWADSSATMGIARGRQRNAAHHWLSSSASSWSPLSC